MATAVAKRNLWIPLGYSGFIPAPSLVHERRNSNIQDVFDYSRQRAELSMRRRF